jgi:hypothetical protein
VKNSKLILGGIIALVVLAGVWYTAGIRKDNEALRDKLSEAESAAASRRPSRSSVRGLPADSRALSEEVRDTLYAALTELTDRVWFVTQPNDPEADLFQRELEATFLEAGWEVVDSTVSPRPLRAGIRVFIAEDDFPDHVSIAVNGLRAAGLEVFAGSGYRAFYQKQKEKDPEFSGVELAPDQDFVIVVGPKPPKTPAADASATPDDSPSPDAPETPAP